MIYFHVKYAHIVVHIYFTYCRALSEVYTSKKSSLKSLVDCFPTEGGSGPNSTTEPPSSVGGKMMLVPPLATGHSLSHEQVIPFLKKLENGQQREGDLKPLALTGTLQLRVSVFLRYTEGTAGLGGDISTTLRHPQTLCGE